MTSGERQHVTLRVEHEDGMYWAEVKEMPGCFASGADLDELMEAMSEAISLYLTDGAGQVELAGMTRKPADLGSYRARKASPRPSIDVSSMGLLIEA